MNKSEKGLQELKEEGKRCFNGEAGQPPQYEQAFLCYSEAIALSHSKFTLKLMWGFSGS